MNATQARRNKQALSAAREGYQAAHARELARRAAQMQSMATTQARRNEQALSAAREGYQVAHARELARRA